MLLCNVQPELIQLEQMLNYCIQATCVLFYTSFHDPCEAVWTFEIHFGVSPYAPKFIGYKSIINYSFDIGMVSSNSTRDRKHLEITFLTKCACMNDYWKVWNISCNILPIENKKKVGSWLKILDTLYKLLESPLYPWTLFTGFETKSPNGYTKTCFITT